MAGVAFLRVLYNDLWNVEVLKCLLTCVLYEKLKMNIL